MIRKFFNNKIFPPKSKRGLIARNIWHFMKCMLRNLFPKTSIIRIQNNKADINIIKIKSDEYFSFDLFPSEILVQVDNFLSGGLENVVLDINEAIMNHWKISLLVLGETGEAVEKARKSGAHVIVTKFNPEIYTVILNSVSPRLVINHYSFDGLEICHKMRIPILQIIHNTYMWFNSDQLLKFKEIGRIASGFITYSEFAKKYSSQRLDIPNEKIRFIPNGINVQKIMGIDGLKIRHDLRKSLFIKDDDFVFLNVAAINHQKNLIGLINAFILASSKIDNLKLMVLGPIYEKDLFDQMSGIIISNHAEGKIKYLGNSHEAFSYYTMADAFILSSFFEGGPLVLLEALTANLPIITTDVGFAELFKATKGVSVISSPVDIMNYFGTIDNLRSNQIFEERLAEQIKNVYIERIKPDLPKDLLELMDKRISYQHYVNFIKEFLNTGELPLFDLSETWVNKIHQLRK